MGLPEADVLTFSETSASLSSFGVFFGRDSASAQAEFIGSHSGIPFTQQGQLDRYRDLRLRPKNQDSDQVIYARVLRQTGGSADAFEAAYPHISFTSGLEL